MGKTESIFAAALLAAIAIAVVWVMVTGGAKTGSHKTADREHQIPGEEIVDVELGSPLIAFTGDEKVDLCTCYEQAYAYGNSPRSIDSIEYRGGYSACTQRLGIAGADAWTWGWANGEEAPGTRRSCRSYLASRR